LWRSGKLEDRVVGKEGEYPVVRRAMDVLLAQYATSLGMAIKYVGGQYVSRNHRGQVGGQPPLTPVPAAKQREALDFLAQRAFAADAFSVAPSLLNDLTNDRWSHWGEHELFGGPGARLDYNLNEKVDAVQVRIVNTLLSPALLSRLREAESHSAEPFRMSELFDRMTKALWGDLGTPAGAKALEGPSTRRELQRQYVDRLAAYVIGPTYGAPDDARALARLQLTKIDTRCAAALAGKAGMGDYTRAHLMETRARIKRALDAHREADPPPSLGGPHSPFATEGDGK
jgi:hypothetical protein